ncbi:MAG: response regulator [bacterium]|nr:MAG: response regulator [bacterium]
MTTDRIKLLIVDDEDSIRHLLRLTFSEEYDIVEAGDGEEAFDVALREQPNLIVSDIMMPRLDGYGLYRKLKSRTETASIPFVFLSAKKDIDERVVGLEMGADDYITKPFSVKELKAKVNSILKKAGDLRLRGSFEGLLGDVDLVEVVQLIEMGRKTGMLVLQGKKDIGRIYFVEGEPRFAEVGPWKGIEAFYSLLAWKEGRFWLDPSSFKAEENLGRTKGQELLMEGVRLIDEMNEASRQLPPASVTLSPSEDQVPTQEDMAQVCRAFEGGTTVEGAVKRTSLPPFRFIPQVAKAMSSGYLRAGSADDGEAGLRSLHRLMDELRKL